MRYLIPFLLLASACGTEQITTTQVVYRNGCTVTPIQADPILAPNGGALIDCGTTTSVITNGLNGQDGANGQSGTGSAPNPYAVVEVIDPCGNIPGFTDQVILRLQSGHLITTVSNGGSVRLVDLDDGSYFTTDGTNCQFFVSGSSVSW